ncbi:Translation elongation factor EF1B, gamma chain, conserved [Pseudocohnilembus persalinus]|uniref:Translation elongation factor EF1B, gamma chain, conserved n=1 Tax=Pseudocohnilembus persalinus TaxID=266149 RepID=A0A0V0RAB2_PSEPJ|nr:Translation elongation factor EF1B, gamma chain, conserved [Pseudocohnilembus persalinus]|eukprot:KRX11205.1 Translation elongation factor EF1B, gamma chain, conserved [Pseudocohnilembus persalinus]
MSHTLYTFPGHVKGQQALIAAKFAGVEVQIKNTPIPSGTRSEEFKAKHALQKVPFLETPEGGLFEGNALIKYFGRKAKLMGKSAFEEARVNQWLDWINCELQPAFYKMLFYVLGHSFGSEQTYKEGKGLLMPALKYLNDYLNHNSYLAGEQLTVADTSLVCVIAPLMYTVIDQNFLKGNVAILRWYNHILSFEPVANIFRKPFVTKKEWVNLKPEKQEKPKKEQQKPKKAAEPKKEKKEEAQQQETKPKDEFDLPPSSFNFFDFKTFIVNEKDKKKGVEEFWKQFDPQGYSIWHVKYDKIEGECEKLFLTSNLKDNTLQRLEKFRKHVFGTFGIYGEEGNYEIEGVWVWRGTQIPQLLKDQPNFEYHKWNKLDHTKPEDRALLEEFWLNMEEDKSKVKGMVARDVQYFK